MKLIKCRKCGATVMTADTLLATMQDEYNELVRKSKHIKGPSKNIILQQMSHLTKMMTAVCHNSSSIELQKLDTYNELVLLKKYIRTNGLLDYEMLNKIRDEARELTRKKSAEGEKQIAELYGSFENHFYNRANSDPTASAAIKNIK